MTKLKNGFILVMTIFCSLNVTFTSTGFNPIFAPPHAFAIEKVSDKIIADDIKNSTISSVLASLLENQARELDAIELESQDIATHLASSLPELQSKTQEINSEFRNISLIYQSSKTAPTELSILTKQNRRLNYEIKSLYTPFEDTQNQVNARLDQLDNLAENLEAMGTQSVAPMLKRVAHLTRTYKAFSNTLKRVLPQSNKLIEQITASSKKFEDNMPSLWLNYYLGDTVNIFSADVWENELNNISDLWVNASLTFMSELPQSPYTWFLLILRTSLACIIIGSLLYASLRVTILLPPIFHNTWKHILKNSMPWLVLGVSLHYGAWHDGNIYQIIASLGTLCLCLGQIRFAWKLFSMNREKDYPTESPFSPMLLTVLISLLLLTFAPLPLTISLLWFVFLIFHVVRLYKAEKSSFPLPRYLMHGFVFVLIIGLFITPTGLVRFSMFITLIYICFAIGLHQATACLYASSIVHDYLPKNGVPALVSGLLLSIAMPIVLLIAMLSPMAWILAYPGGEYLIKNFGNFDFNIGAVSFNTMQILSVLIVFYLTRSLIAVSCSYIDTSWSRNTNAAASLSTPIKTAIIFGLWGLFVLYVLKIIGFSLTSLAVIAGGLSVGIGLGLQGFVQNIFSGFSLIFGQNIREGDVVLVTGITGIVQKVSLRATQVRTYDNAIVFVPNSEFLATTFTNWTHNGRMVRCALNIGVAYGSDLELVMETALSSIKEQENILKYPEPQMLFMEFGGSSLDFEIRFWIKEIEDRMPTLTTVRLAIDKAFKEKNIEIPFPRTDINIRNHTEPVEFIPMENIKTGVMLQEDKKQEDSTKEKP